MSHRAPLNSYVRFHLLLSDGMHECIRVRSYHWNDTIQDENMHSIAWHGCRRRDCLCLISGKLFCMWLNGTIALTIRWRMQLWCVIDSGIATFELIRTFFIELMCDVYSDCQYFGRLIKHKFVKDFWRNFHLNRFLWLLVSIICV